MVVQGSLRRISVIVAAPPGYAGGGGFEDGELAYANALTAPAWTVPVRGVAMGGAAVDARPTGGTVALGMRMESGGRDGRGGGADDVARASMASLRGSSENIVSVMVWL